jgi:hypothetical protein
MMTLPTPAWACPACRAAVQSGIFETGHFWLQLALLVLPVGIVFGTGLYLFLSKDGDE